MDVLVYAVSRRSHEKLTITGFAEIISAADWPRFKPNPTSSSTGGLQRMFTLGQR